MSFKEIDLISLLPRIWGWLTNIDNWNTPEGWLARGVVWLVIVGLIFRLLKHLLNEFLEIRDKWKQAGLPVVQFSPEQVAKLRHRKQFCNVLCSDLATIAKAESWNDQYFTDLEAEIEAEGFYYASNFDRLIRRKSFGLRRESSLLKSIDQSAEQFLLLVGEPGSGKSVAMRHLAHQFAERAIRSNSLNEKIPLYINLKELPSAPNDEPTPTFIEQFVLENIRRGDADTVDYIRDHWDDYRERGIWFFLFDSFDEIPAVMHAPTGSTVMQKYSEAIRQFLVSMSSCHGIVASREFKGPETLPWQKFRILPLSPKRQDQLINNSFLKSHEKQIVRQHLATYSSNIHHNPMFLTLLCRYVKDNKQVPMNDYDLLYKHIERLAQRDTEYIRKKHNVTPINLLNGALQLAVLFAEYSELSLAPTQDDIKRVLEKSDQTIDNLENVLSALIDVKIGRCDVPEAHPGDRRFTFAHRRYQEALFVQYLSEHPAHIAPHELLTNSRWREYCVTLLQTQSIEILLPILQTSEQLLEECREPVPVTKELGGHLMYYEWKDDPTVLLLRLLQDGFSRRICDVPQSLSQKVQAILQMRWNNGDEYDRKMVLDVGGLLPQTLLLEYLTEAIQYGVDALHQSALQKIAFLENVSEDLVHWARQRLSDEVLQCIGRRQFLKLQVLSTDLPESIDAQTVLRRSRQARNMNIVFRIVTLFANWTGISYVELSVYTLPFSITSLVWISCWVYFALSLYLPLHVLVTSQGWGNSLPILAFQIGMILLYGSGLLLFIKRTIPRDAKFRWSGVQRIKRSREPIWTLVDSEALIMLIPVFILLPVLFCLQFIIKDAIVANYIFVYPLLLVFLPYICLLLGLQYLHFVILQKRYPRNPLFIFQARSNVEMQFWLGFKKIRSRLAYDVTTTRSLIRIFSTFKIQQFEHPLCLQNTPFLRQKYKNSIAANANTIINRLMKCLGELDEKA